MKTLITNYRNPPGEHCGSAATRNLLYHYCGLELSESVIFGLGAGIESMFIKVNALDPAISIFGRSISMEAVALGALGIDYREQPEFDNQKAWEDVRNLYTGFLEWAAAIVPDIVNKNHITLSDQSAQNWTLLANLLQTASENPGSADIWQHASDKVMEIRDIESELFASLYKI